MGNRWFTAKMLCYSALFLSLNSCIEDRLCPSDYICITGNTISYQEGPDKPKVTLEAPPEAVYNNTQIFFSDLSGDPGLSYYSNRYFGHACFRIEPKAAGLRQLVKLSIEYVAGSQIDSIGNDFGPDFRLYSIDEDGNWALVPASITDTARRTTFAQVSQLGKYAIAAPKHCLVGEWWSDPPTGEYGFKTRLRFWKNGNGDKAVVVDCDPSGSESFDLATSTFNWHMEGDQLILDNISAENACGNNTPPLSTTIASPYVCGWEEMVVNLGSSPQSFSRRH